MIIKDELTYKIIGCAINVHNVLGNGFQACLPKGSTARRQEVIYQRCLAIELDHTGIAFGREVEQPIFYKGFQVGIRNILTRMYKINDRPSVSNPVHLSCKFRES